MPVIVGGKIIEGGEPQSISGAGAPANGTDEIQTITIGGTPEVASTFRLTYDGWKTTPIVWSSVTNTLIAHIDAALEALPNIGTAGVTTADGTSTLGVGTFTVTFVGANGKTNVALIVGSDFLQSDGTASDGTVSVATTTPGVTATGRGSAPGTRYNDYTNGVDYTNTGTAIAPTWTAVSVGNISVELINLAAAIPVAALPDLSAADPGAVAAADAVAAAGLTPAGGTGATAGAYDTAAHRDAFIATVAEIEVTVNALVTLANELKAKQAVNRTELIELKADHDTLLASLRTAGIVTP
jgi:hypothetical protein